MKNAILGFLIGFLLVILGADLAHAQQLPVPIYPTGEKTCAIPVANKMACGRFLAPQTVTNATKIALNLGIGYGGSTTCSAAIYPDSDVGGQITGTGALNCGTAGVHFATGLTPFTLTAGTVYRVCECADSNVGTYNCPNWVGSTGFAALQNAFVVSVGSAANNCVAGVANFQTGALSSDASLEPPILLLSVE